MLRTPLALVLVLALGAPAGASVLGQEEVTAPSGLSEGPLESGEGFTGDGNVVVASAGAVADAGTIPGNRASRGTPLKSGKASWYGPGFHGRKTASGEIYDQNAMTAAMTGVPLRITVRVERVDTGASVTVRVNDRGPYQRRGGRWVPHSTRVIDLSRAAMRRLGGIHAGIIDVRVYRID